MHYSVEPNKQTQKSNKEEDNDVLFYEKRLDYWYSIERKRLNTQLLMTIIKVAGRCVIAVPFLLWYFFG